MKHHLFSLLLAAALAAPPAEASSTGLAAAYLSATHANRVDDFGRARDVYADLVESAGENPVIFRDALVTFVSAGDMESALEIAERMRDAGIRSWLASLVMFAEAVRSGDFDAAEPFHAEFEELGQPKEVGMSRELMYTREDIIRSVSVMSAQEAFHAIVNGLLRGWIEFGKGRMTAAREQFDGMDGTADEARFGRYHKMLALALAGDFEGAYGVISESTETGGILLGRGSIIAQAQILSQVERNSDAIALLDDVFGTYDDRSLTELRDRLAAGERIEFDLIRSASDAIAEVYHFLAANYPNRTPGRVELVHARLADYLRAGGSESTVLTAGILLDLGQYSLAATTYESVEEDDPLYLDAALGRSDSLIEAGEVDAGIAVLRELAAMHPGVRRVHTNLGDALRRAGRYDEATDSYDAAVKLTTNPDRLSWFLHYARGMTLEREGRWDEAEADFRRALELSPGQPLVLNYLGYSLVEKQQSLDEARKMIEEAVQARPNDGYIVDSLGWVLYRQGLYEEAVERMERAVELSPTDPVINDHLGDVYWKVGRKREAEFQWRRALSLDPEEDEVARILRKLDLGLDAVLVEEETGGASGEGGQ